MTAATAPSFYLQHINPLRGLTEEGLLANMELGERGAYAFIQWIYRSVERRNPTARTVRRRLLAAIGKLQWDVKTADAGDDAQKQSLAEAQAQALRKAYDAIRNLRTALRFLAQAELRGFSHLEKIHAGESAAASGAAPDPWKVVELRPVEQWFWVRQGLYGDWQYNRTAAVGALTGETVDLSRFIVREVDDPADEIIAKLHLRQDTNDADWDGYLEEFGQPSVFVTGPPNVPADKELDYQRTAEQIANGARGYLPNGAKVDTVAAQPGSSAFKERLEYLDGQMVIAATSGKLTILTESGAGTLAGNAQADAFDEIASEISEAISEALQAQFDRPFLAEKFPGQPVLAYFTLAHQDTKDGSKALGDAKTAGDAGYVIDLDELSEKSGYKLTRRALPTAQSAPTQTSNQQHEKEVPPPRAADGANGRVAPPAPQGSPPATQSVATPPEGADSPEATAKAAPAVTPQNLADATAAQLGVTPDYLAPVAATFADLIASAQDGAVSNDEFLATADELMKKLPLLARMMDTTGIATALAAAMSNAAADAVQPA